ncbi:MAG TPA: formyltransferase family protein [Candidatus Deferrimicrobium sp.]|nr:formyltransferase family protein [Candidatus Deferrimicrobium sp.]
MATASRALDAARDALWERDEFSFIPDRNMPALEGTASPSSGPRVLFAGFPSDYSLAFLLALLQLEVEVVGLLTSPGAHEAILGDNALSRIADHLEIPLLRAWRVNDEHSILDLVALRLDGVVMASFDQIVGSRALSVPTHGWMNVHPSALPARRGPEPVYWTIADGDPIAGITLHRAVPKVDAGPILAQRTVAVDAEDTSGTLTRRLCELGAATLGEAVERLLTDWPGDPIDMTAATYAPSVGHRHVDAAPSAGAGLRMIRAGVPNMPAWTLVGSRVAYVLRAHLGAPREGQPAIAFADGIIALDEHRAACGCHHNLVSCPHRQE